MPPAPTPRQQQMVALAAELAERFAPRVDADERAGRFPIETSRELHAAGYLRLIVPPEYGGAGASLYETVLAQERLAQGDGATAMAVNMTMHLIGRQAELGAETCAAVTIARGLLDGVRSGAQTPRAGIRAERQ